MKQLEGKAAVVTGGARGIGLDYAERLASLGANVAVCDINLDSARQYQFETDRLVDGSLEKTLRRFGGDVQLGTVDANDPAALAGFFAEIHARWQRIDILVANAGGGSDTKGSAPSELTADAILTTFNRNLFSTMHTCAAAVPYLKAAKGSKIVTIASLSGIQAAPGGRAADYATAKAGVAQYTRLLAQELAPFGVNVNAIAPGYIATGQWQARFGNNDQAVLDDFARQVPFGRLGTSTDCANVVEFLTTSLSDYVTGQVIAVDGGICRWPC